MSGTRFVNRGSEPRTDLTQLLRVRVGDERIPRSPLRQSTTLTQGPDYYNRLDML
jgi:hypothetical protein